MSKSTKAQKKALYEKVKQKTFEKRVKEGEVLPPETELVYDNYKEPLRKVDHGFGYAGTLAQNKEKTHVQCHICGYFFKALGGHLKSAHKTNTRDYKKEFGLALTTALIGDVTRAKFILSHSHKKGSGLPVWLKEYAAKNKNKPRKKSRPYPLELHNKAGTCPDQIIEKIKTLGDEIGRTPSYEEFLVRYNYRYHASVILHFGTFSKAIKKAGYKKTREQERTYTKKELLQYLKTFRKAYGRCPMTSDFKRGLLPVSRGTYNYHFGTFNHARLAAGMPAIIPLSNGHYYELDADKFDEYEAFKEQPYKNKGERNRKFKDLIASVQK